MRWQRTSWDLLVGVLVELFSRAVCATSAASPKFRVGAAAGCTYRLRTAIGGFGRVGRREPSAGTRRADRPCWPSEGPSRPRRPRGCDLDAATDTRRSGRATEALRAASPPVGKGEVAR